MSSAGSPLIGFSRVGLSFPVEFFMLPLLMIALISGTNAAYGSIIIPPENNSKYSMNQWYFDTELHKNVGIIVSRIIIENETSESIQGYLADSKGTRLDMVDEGSQVVMARHVWNNTSSTDWGMFGWLHDGYFEVQKPENTEILYAIRIHIGSIDYILDDEELPYRLKSIIFINPAWAEFRTSDDNSNNETEQSVSEGTNSTAYRSVDPPESQNIYDPATYEARHCNYLSDLHQAYSHCTMLYIKEDEEEDTTIMSDDDEDDARRDEPDETLATVAETLEKTPAYITKGNITMIDIQHQIVEANVFGGANFSYPLMQAIDTMQGDISDGVICDPASGSFFPLNETITVSCSVGNNRNETIADSFNVTVTDTTVPLIAAMEDIIVEGSTPGGAIVMFAVPNSTDIADAHVEASCEPNAGSFFALGSTLVACTAIDDSGNNATSFFNATVVDATPPVLTLPEDLNYEALDGNMTSVVFVVNATDVVDPAPLVTCNNTLGEPVESGQLFPVGETEIVCHATDGSGNISQLGIFIIRVTTPETE